LKLDAQSRRDTTPYNIFLPSTILVIVSGCGAHCQGWPSSPQYASPRLLFGFHPAPENDPLPPRSQLFYSFFFLLLFHFSRLHNGAWAPCSQRYSRCCCLPPHKLHFHLSSLPPALGGVLGFFPVLDHAGLFVAWGGNCGSTFPSFSIPFLSGPRVLCIFS